ncbi:MAG: hypothetical protein AAF108_09230, partial [Planctomycetota bacterium]
MFIINNPRALSTSRQRFALAMRAHDARREHANTARDAAPARGGARWSGVQRSLGRTPPATSNRRARR